MVMVYVPAGEFLMGSADSDADASSDEKPQHRVYLDAFWIDRTEVTNEMFAKFVKVSGHKTDTGTSFVLDLASGLWIDKMTGFDWQHPRGPDSNLAGLDQHPVTLVSWNDAVAYCTWVGRRLPTEAEWEKAARGTDELKFPWGDQDAAGDLLNFADSNLDIPAANKGINDGSQFTAPVGSYPKGASPYDVWDMAGNVWEWVTDWYDPAYYRPVSVENPRGPDSKQRRVLRGGAWTNEQKLVRAATRYSSQPNLRYVSVGFRCARSP
jgi:serine/threonine-protein kinase